jgi:hypothetical protein
VVRADSRDRGSEPRTSCPSQTPCARTPHGRSKTNRNRRTPRRAKRRGWRCGGRTCCLAGRVHQSESADRTASASPMRICRMGCTPRTALALGSSRGHGSWSGHANAVTAIQRGACARGSRLRRQGDLGSRDVVERRRSHPRRRRRGSGACDGGRRGRRGSGGPGRRHPGERCRRRRGRDGANR